MTVKKFIALRVMEGSFILGSCFLLGASGCAIKDAVTLHYGISTSGTVTEVTPTSIANDPFYQTTFMFNALDGRSYTVTPDLMERPAPYKIGDSIPIVYKATNPHDASIASAKELWREPIGFGVGGAAVLVVGLIFWKKNRMTYLSNSNVNEQTGYGRV